MSVSDLHHHHHHRTLWSNLVISKSSSSCSLFLALVAICAIFLLPDIGSMAANVTSGKCTKEGNQTYDGDIARLMSVGQFGRAFPERFEDVEAYCSETKRLNEKIDNYKSKCATGVQKEFTSVILYSIKSTVKQLCKTKRTKRMEKVMKSMACANTLSNKTATCYNTFIDKYQGIPKAATKKQIPHACCEYIKLLTCFENAFQTATPKCQSQSEAFLDFVRSIFDDIVNLTCNEYNETNDKCDKMPSPPAKDKKDKRPKSFLLPLMKIWESSDRN